MGEIKKSIMEEVKKLIKKDKSILTQIDEIEKLKQTVPTEKMGEFVNFIREIVQKEAIQAVIDNNGGMVAMATGAGKSKVAVELAKHFINSTDKSLGLIVPTEKLRDENWKEEYFKWGAEHLWIPTIRLCYASASKIKNKDFELAILDEAHNLTSLSSEFFLNNNVEKTVLLTATPPSDSVKQELFSTLGLKLVYKLTLDQAVRLGFVAPYEINVVSVPLENTLKNIKGGSKLKPFMTTETSTYNFLSQTIKTLWNSTRPLDKFKHKHSLLKRMHFIHSLPSKTNAIKYLLEKVVSKEDRSIIFCSTIEQAETVCENFYHSKSDNKGYKDFKEEFVNRLSCVKSLDEGHNFSNIDSIIIGQLNSTEKNLIQRIGRGIRYRPGHLATIWIVISKGTQDEVWLESAIKNLDKSKITYFNLKDLQNERTSN